MAKREFLQLAHDFVPQKYNVCGYYASEKMDGVRLFWDGGISRGLYAREVPWANIEKHGRYVSEPQATGLWTRYGQPVQAPEWWLDSLPRVPLDGEAFRGRGEFQSTLSVVRALSGRDHEWHSVRFAVFESPALTQVFADGGINSANYKKQFTGIIQWLRDRGADLGVERPYYETLHFLKGLGLDGYAYLHPQEKLPSSWASCNTVIENLNNKFLALGAEGLILRSPVSLWRPERTYDLLKVKPCSDCEGTVIGYRWGDKTDVERSISGNVTNRLVGLMGSLRLRLDSGVEFNLASGFTLGERTMRAMNGCDEPESTAYTVGCLKTGEVVEDRFENPLFPRDARITFRYRELTDDGVPKEARYYRLRQE